MSQKYKYEITDEAALEKEYPELFSEVTIVKKKVDRKKLYACIKHAALLGRPIPGVKIEGLDSPASEAPAANKAEAA